MTTEQFAYWLQGFCEIHGAPPSAEQWEMIKKHLQTCFVKVTGEPGQKISYGVPKEWLLTTSDPRLMKSPSVITC
ncbi:MULTISPECIES: hypothetical protein [Pantoea]|jgi:hypothetical protein|uniref:Uncharacterized protein n=2 Tax=root TaxID=1 RepID=A0A7Y6NFT5_9GAMM|nr:MULTISPECIES: hypothetical protein [Pantoea]DAE23023.1 MAG TPA: hypothetical protein [Siphoviridae sp. ct2u94]MBZ6396544.1 hypothetical protein [Pantoea sp.]MBZ6438381.1 hypothetical protein [Pantoea sp.]MDU7868592.1 hypothetical protein [Pantoea sp.]NUY42774.1 hypothetical protein [Pantoea brenneri]